MPSRLSRKPLVSGEHLPLPSWPQLRALELGGGKEPLLQRFFDDNPLYFESVHGEPARPTEPHEEIHGTLPAGWPHTRKWVIGYATEQDDLVAMANIVCDFLAPSVWHIGTFIVATSQHGSGSAQLLYRNLDSWARSHGAQSSDGRTAACAWVVATAAIIGPAVWHHADARRLP